MVCLDLGGVCVCMRVCDCVHIMFLQTQVYSSWSNISLHPGSRMRLLSWLLCIVIQLIVFKSTCVHAYKKDFLFASVAS